MTILLSHSTWGMPTVSIDTAVAHCAALGFDGLEMTVVPRWPTNAADLDTAERKRIRKLYDDHNLILSGLSGATPLLTADPESATEHLARVKTYLDLAAEMQHPGEKLTVSSVSGGTEADWETRKHELVERYGILAAYAEQVGALISMEPHIGAALHLPEQSVWLVEQINSPALRIHLDISHFNIRGLDMDKVIELVVPYSAHMHVKDERGLAPNHEFLIPGEGEMDYVRYLRALDKAGYHGHVATEISIAVQRRPDYDPLAAATQSYRVLSQAFTEAGLDRKV